ncbi:Transferase [Penicillium expansum]|uniref:Transferase n=1 Tax=Penicillium expansum TaxID=27334 RepID=A0A0A2IWT8_PENEN|nr:Transferase [Penicillium expansum]KGO47519.1 Transferase [Penicillium expansum]KGO54760.1 Transferase [Penicillium expansum]
MEFETDEQLPPTFEPYVATPLDHSMTPTHLAAFLTFSLDKPFKAIPILEAGVTRLVRYLPFLTGNVTFSTLIPHKENVFEIQPPTKQFLLEHPMLKIKYHEQPIFSQQSSLVVAQDIVLSEDIIPIPFALAEDYPSPIFRFQANVMPDGIILCFNFHHTAIDGIGIAGIMDALAVCCRDPDAVTEARSKLRPKLPLSYIGNAVILQPVYTPLTAIVSSTTSSNYNTHITPRLDYDDIKLLAELTSSVHTALGSVCDETIRELISAIAASNNWAANPRPNDVIISSLRSFPTYSLDFGPGFGPVRDFDMPERRIPGQAWIMPARYKGQSSPWEVRLALDPGVMGNIEKDRLMTWLGPREVSKV